VNDASEGNAETRSDPDDSLSGGQFSVRIIETDGNVVELAALTDGGAVCVITEMTKVGEDLVLSKLHIDGPGAGSSGIQTLRALAKDAGKAAGRPSRDRPRWCSDHGSEGRPSAPTHHHSCGGS
jgi:hypothetical protein